MQKKDSIADGSDEDMSDSSIPPPPKRETTRRATKVHKTSSDFLIHSLTSSNFFNFQKVDYAKLLNDEDEDEGSASGAGSVQALSSDDEFNSSIKQPVSLNSSSSSGGANMFDSLKEDTPVKKAAPPKRKLGPKAADVKKPTKQRIKKRPVSDDSSDDDFTSRKVS